LNSPAPASISSVAVWRFAGHVAFSGTHVQLQVSRNAGGQLMSQSLRSLSPMFCVLLFGLPDGEPALPDLP
jgi:hypothetical protein